MVVHTIKEKRRIIAEASAHGASKKGTGRLHNVQAGQIRRWIKAFNNCTLEMLNERSNKRTLHQAPRESMVSSTMKSTIGLGI